MENKRFIKVCNDYYLISPMLHELLTTSHLPNNLKHEFNKEIHLNKSGVFLVTFRTVLHNNKPVLIYKYLFYNEIFTDLFLMFLITRIRYKDSLTYENWDNIFTLIDSSLSYNKEDLIKILMTYPPLFNEYLHLETNNVNNVDNIDNIKWIDYLKLFVNIENIDAMSLLLNWAYEGGKSNIKFLQGISASKTTDMISTDTNILNINLLNSCIFVVKDLEGFLKTIRKTHSDVNQGIQKWRGQLNTMSSLLLCIDQDFRSSLYNYNQYHLEKKNLPSHLSLSKHNTSFNNIHKNLGNIKWYSTKSNSWNNNNNCKQLLKKNSNLAKIFKVNILNYNKYYSSSNYLGSNIDNNNFKYDLLLQWFVGFSDAESNFIIIPKFNNNININRFTFRFTIKLHIDDLNTLIFIKHLLNIGSINKNKDECAFIITKKEEIKKLINIFDKHKLNTTKYLDYSDFKKAFILYNERTGNVTKELVDNILFIKNGMNKNRINFIMDKNHIKITNYWLLGLIEGEGSFQIWRTNIIPVFSIVMTKTQLPVFYKIKEFLFYNLGFNSNDKIKLENTSTISINIQKGRNNSKDSVLFLIKNINIIYNYLIPFLENLKFITKKSKDFEDFKIISRAVYYFAHKDSEIKSLILRLSYSMNNFRLSTCRNKLSINLLNDNERNVLINIKPQVEYLHDGRLINIYTRKILHQYESSIYKIIKPNNEIIFAQTLTETAKIIGINIKTLSKYLDKEILESEEYTVNIKNNKIKRIKVFLK